jgi:ABC-type transport system substrate-binding protein
MLQRLISRPQRILRFIAPLAAAALVACGGGTGGNTSSTPVKGGTLTVAFGSDVNSFDPIKTTGPYDELMNGVLIGQKLMAFTTSGKPPTALLATSLDASSDLKSWTVHLRKGVTFQDGTPFNAQAVKFNLDREMDPANAISAASIVAPIASVNVVDDSTVRFDLKSPWGTFPYALSFPPFIIHSPTAIQKWGKDYSQHPSGTGPYTLASYTPGSEIVLERNQKYWGTAPYLDKIDFKIISNATTAYQSLIAGNIDLDMVPQPKDIVAAKSNSKLAVVQVPSREVPASIIALNVNKPPLNDAGVRQALSYAVDRQALITGLGNGLGSPSQGPFAGSTWDNHIQYPGYDLSKAQQLIKDYQQRSGNSNVSFTLDAIGADQGAVALQGMWQKIGVTVTIRTMDVPTTLKTLFQGQYEAKRFSSSIYPHPDFVFYAFVTSNSPLNLAKWNNPDVDAAMNAARTTTNVSTQTTQYGIVDKWMAEQVPWIWLDNPFQGWIYSTNVHGLVADNGTSLPNLPQIWVKR